MPFCQRCNTNLENYMKFCWNCGQPQSPPQTFGGGAPVQQHAQSHSSGHYQESISTSSGSGPYEQSVTVTYGGTGMGPAPPPPQGQPVRGNRVMLPCPFCEGEGTHPMNFDQPCPVCRGAGKFTVWEPYSQCQQCEGSGKRFATMDEMCPSCHGRGVIQI